jgi:hypothetical protein
MGPIPRTGRLRHRPGTGRLRERTSHVIEVAVDEEGDGTATLRAS